MRKGASGHFCSIFLPLPPCPFFPQECISTRFKAVRINGGDTLFSHCAFFLGVAPTDPGASFLDPGFNAFDWGGQQVGVGSL